MYIYRYVYTLGMLLFIIISLLLESQISSIYYFDSFFSITCKLLRIKSNNSNLMRFN